MKIIINGNRSKKLEYIFIFNVSIKDLKHWVQVAHRKFKCRVKRKKIKAEVSEIEARKTLENINEPKCIFLTGPIKWMNTELL